MIMREILFRGQTRRKGERIINVRGDKCDSNWVYGGIFPQNNGGDFAIIYQQTPEIKKYTVYADTVGQYTGLTDKNGVKIFEGDIVTLPGEDNPCEIVWNDTEAKFEFKSFDITADFDNYWAQELEVIANKYDYDDPNCWEEW
nr:MAG TPA: YopX protein [Caudoviricetes sp.]